MKVNSYSLNYLRNYLKLSENFDNLSEYLYDILFPIDGFSEERIKDFFRESFNYQDDRINRLYKITVLMFYQIDLMYYSMIDLTNVNTENNSKNENKKEYPSVGYLKSLDSQEEFIQYILNQCLLFQNKYHNNLNNDIHVIINYIMKIYLVPNIHSYLNNNITDSIANITDVNYKVDYLRNSSMIISYRKKILFLDNSINSYISSNNLFTTYSSFSDINNNITSYSTTIIIKLLDLNYCLIDKYLKYSLRNDIGKLVKIEKNDMKKPICETNQCVHLIFSNLVFVTSLLKDVLISKISEKMIIYKSLVDNISTIVNRLNSSFSESMIFARVTKDSRELISDMRSFKNILLDSFKEVLNKTSDYLELNKLKEKEIPKIINNLSDRMLW